MKRLLVIVILHLLHLCEVPGAPHNSANVSGLFTRSDKGSDEGFKPPWWFGLVVALLILPVIIYLLYRCFHPRTVAQQFLKSYGFQ
ncbi:uncharacterized protein LOC143774386 isoform X2 [Ranitomeya variabilis]